MMLCDASSLPSHRPTDQPASRNYYDLDFVFIFSHSARALIYVRIFRFSSLLLLPASCRRCDNDLSTFAALWHLFHSPASIQSARHHIWMNKYSEVNRSGRWRACRYVYAVVCVSVPNEDENIDEKLLFVDKMPTTFPFFAYKYFIFFLGADGGYIDAISQPSIEYNMMATVTGRVVRIQNRCSESVKVMWVFC